MNDLKLFLFPFFCSFIVEVSKDLGVDKKYLPYVSIITGVIISLLFDFFIIKNANTIGLSISTGIQAGLIGVGGYEALKKILKKNKSI